jgi:phosphatidylserine/phosphatidylglycerophosphate/cardiolipin synthase-like enzyme
MNRQPILFAALVVGALGFAIGYAAGSGGGLASIATPPSAAPAAKEDGIACFFSPKGGCTQAVVAEIDKAQKTIQLQAYSFTSAEIVRALIDAHHRGVQVTAVFDKSDLKEKSRAVEEVVDDKIAAYVDSQHAIAHNKIILIDGRTLITGSFNFTNQAEHSNAENLLVIHDHAKLYAAYEENFQHHLGHSEPYASAESPSEAPSRSRERRTASRSHPLEP